MISIQEIYQTGPGPSGCCSVFPYNAAFRFKEKNSHATTIKATLYGDLAKEADEFFTVQVIKKAISPLISKVILDKDVYLPEHPYGIRFEAHSKDKGLIDTWIVYFSETGIIDDSAETNYPYSTPGDILNWTYSNGRKLWEYAFKYDLHHTEDYLKTIWETMKETIVRGLGAEGRLPGAGKRERMASQFFTRAQKNRDFVQQISKTMAYSLAVSEENTTGNVIITAPTSRSSGILPAVLYSLQEVYKISEKRIIRAMATAGLIGSIIHGHFNEGKNTLSEVAAAAAMASAAACQIMGGSPNQIMGAAAICLKNINRENGPVYRTPEECIELNALAAARAIDCTTWSLLSCNDLTRDIDSFNKMVISNSDAVKVKCE